MAAKLATLFCWYHRPPAAPPPIEYTSSCREHQRSTEGKIVSKYCNISKTQGGGGGSIHPSTLYHGGDMTLRVRSRPASERINRGDVSHPPCFKLYQWGEVTKPSREQQWKQARQEYPCSFKLHYIQLLLFNNCLDEFSRSRLSWEATHHSL